ncbi:hypothetical protein ACHAW5_000265 [Stephanodiscus triporus]|uniref:DUF7640 domain-containing protein n=1 Tax=Stephanodiscus triporus TaxID=2934178 RepID=A0ABD3MMY4_9STRA
MHYPTAALLLVLSITAPSTTATVATTKVGPLKNERPKEEDAVDEGTDPNSSAFVNDHDDSLPKSYKEKEENHPADDGILAIGTHTDTSLNNIRGTKGRVESSSQHGLMAHTDTSTLQSKADTVQPFGRIRALEAPPNFVQCENGLVIDNGGVIVVMSMPGPTLTCAEECGGDCCVGDGACDGFTGKVYRDGSCDGIHACFGAIIPTVSGGGCNGDYACKKANIPAVDDSCNRGKNSCSYVGYYGIVDGWMVKSCQGDKACFALAYAKSGKVHNVSKSCKGEQACAHNEYNTHGDILKSCNANHACIYQEDIISDMDTCCNNPVKLKCQNVTEDSLPKECIKHAPQGNPFKR